eukprot:g1922.t1
MYNDEEDGMEGQPQNRLDEEEEYFSEDDGSDEEFDINAGNLPAFANAESRALSKALEEKEEQVEVLAREAEENEERVKIMSEHLKHVKQELLHTQSLVEAKSKECKTEEHLKALSEREVGGIRIAINKLNVQIEEQQDALNVVQNNIFKGNEKLDRFKLQMNWNQEELEQWALAAKQKEEDNLALQKYTRADEAKIKDITLQIEKLTILVSEKKNDLDHEVTETQSKQIELDKTAEEFRKLHKERQDLVKQWQDSIEAMRRRDEDIRRAGERFADAKASFNRTKDAVKEIAKELEDIKKDNAETEGKLKVKERQVELIRLNYTNTMGTAGSFADETEAIKNQLSKCAAELAAKRAQTGEQRRVLEDKRSRLEVGRKQYIQAKKILNKEANSVVDAEQMAKQMEEDLERNEKQFKQVERQVNKLKEVMFKSSQELFTHRQAEANFIAEISGAQAASKNLNHKITELDQSSLRQQELIYTAEFQIQQMERKVARAGGERSDEEKIVLNAKIKLVQAGLDEVKEQQKMLKMQEKKIMDELVVRKRTLRESIDARNELRGRIAELELVNNAAVATLKEQKKSRKTIMVNHDVLKLEVKRLRDKLSLHADEVFGLANRKFQLQQSMEERKHEIQVHRDVQRAAHKAAEEERHKVALESKERMTKVKSLKLKYESLCAAARGSDGGDDEEKSQAFFIIQAAQQKEALQREGDELDSKIRRAEREMKAIENTLNHLNTRNTVYRKSFQHADMNSKEAAELNQMGAQLKISNDNLFKKKKELQRLTADQDEDARRIRQMEKNTEQLSAHMRHLEDAHQQVIGELDDQKRSLEESERRVREMAIDHRRSKNVADDVETLEEKQFMAQGLRETSANVLYTLGQLGREFPEMRDTLTEALKSQGLQIPARPPSRVMSRGSSRASRRTNESRGNSRGGGLQAEFKNEF